MWCNLFWIKVSILIFFKTTSLVIRGIDDLCAVLQWSTLGRCIQSVCFQNKINFFSGYFDLGNISFR